MRVDMTNHFVSQSFFSENTVLQPGLNIRGEVLEQSSDRILLRVNNELIEAMLAEPMEDVRGQFLNFLVLSGDKGEILLKLQKMGMQVNDKQNPDSSLTQLLTQLGIETNEKTLEAIQNMMNYSITINKPNIREILNLSSRLDSLIHLKETDHIFSLEKPLEQLIRRFSQQPETVFLKEDLLSGESKLLKYVELSLEEGAEIQEVYEKLLSSEDILDAEESIKKLVSDIKEKSFQTGKLNIGSYLKESMEKKMISTFSSVSDLLLDKVLISEKSISNNLQDIGKEVHQFFKEVLMKETVSSSQIVSFFKKNNISLTLGNIKTMIHYLNEPKDLFQDFQKMDQVIRKYPELFENEMIAEKEITHETQLSIPLNRFNSLEVLSKLQKLYSEEETWMEKIRFIQDMNKDMNFMFFPIHQDPFLKGGFVHYLKERQQRKVDYHKDLNIMINVETHHVGNVAVFCKTRQKKMDIKLSIQEEDLELFQSDVEKLKRVIEELGFEVNSLNFIFDKKYNLLDFQFSSGASNCFLDVRV